MGQWFSVYSLWTSSISLPGSSSEMQKRRVLGPAPELLTLWVRGGTWTQPSWGCWWCALRFVGHQVGDDQHQCPLRNGWQAILVLRSWHRQRPPQSLDPFVHLLQSEYIWSFSWVIIQIESFTWPISTTYPFFFLLWIILLVWFLITLRLALGHEDFGHSHRAIKVTHGFYAGQGIAGWSNRKCHRLVPSVSSFGSGRWDEKSRARSFCAEVQGLWGGAWGGRPERRAAVRGWATNAAHPTGRRSSAPHFGL